MLRVNEKSRLCIVGIASIVVFRPVEGDYGDRGNTLLMISIGLPVRVSAPPKV